jgi:hypothetical protein
VLLSHNSPLLPPHSHPRPVTPFAATLTRRPQPAEKPTSLTPAFATLMRRVNHNPFVCHSCKKQGGGVHSSSQTFALQFHSRLSDSLPSLCAGLCARTATPASSFLSEVYFTVPCMLGGWGSLSLYATRYSPLSPLESYLLQPPHPLSPIESHLCKNHRGAVGYPILSVLPESCQPKGASPKTLLTVPGPQFTNHKSPATSSVRLSILGSLRSCWHI